MKHLGGWVERILPPVWATLIALGVGSLLVLAVGGAPLEVLGLLGRGTFGQPYGIGQVLFKATPLVFAGLAVALGMRAGLFNIGVEGQLTAGAFAMGMTGAHLPVATPRLVAVSLCLAAGFLAGAVLGGLAGLLKAARGAHEVITTIMLNFVVRAAVVGMGARVFVKESVHTSSIIDGARLPRLSTILPILHGSALNAGLGLALLSAALVGWLIERTYTGFRLRALGQAPEAAENAGISVYSTTVLALALSGGIGGLTGSSFVLGYKYYFEDGFSGGIGYMGIAVAVLGRGRSLGVLLAALVLGSLSEGALAVNAVVPKELVDVLQAVIIVAVAATAVAVPRIMARP